MSSTDPLFLAFQNALAGRYSIDRELGRGGMGIVYLAREIHLDRLVAIKLLPPALAARPGLRTRFKREAQMAAKLSHPHIVPIHAVDETDGFVYFVMAYVAGGSLAERVQQRGPMPSGEGARVLREIAWALSYAHGHGVVHRDIKPDNILLEAETGRALVADFGIAAAIDTAAHELGTPELGTPGIGTPEFMSPEQALGQEVDARSDLYSLGATAFYALSGRLPFAGTSTTELLARQVTETAPSLGTVAIGVPRKVVQCVDRCLAKAPTDRPSSAQQLADELGAAIEQRRELPAALRAFVKRTGRMDGGGTLLCLVGSLAAGVALSSVTGPMTGVLTIVGGMVASAVGFGILAARRLQNLGFTHADLAPAYRAELDSSREERVITSARGRTFVEGALRSMASVLACTSAVLLVVAAITSRDGAVIGRMAVVGLLLASVPTLGYVLLLQLRRDVDVEVWGALWTGRPGAWAFAVARKWRGTTPIGPAMTHRATELSLGMAAEQLYETLPKVSRASLGDLPGLLQRLQREAHLLRVRSDQLHDALSESGASSRSDHYAALCIERDAVQVRLRDVMAALESIRLGLLRLHAGSLSVETLTTQLGLAAEASADVDRLIAAHDEVNTVLRFPRAIELTPV